MKGTLMLKLLCDYIKGGSPRKLPNWDNNLLSIKLRTGHYKTKFYATEYVQTPGSVMLQHLIQSTFSDADILNSTSDYNLYISKIDGASERYRNIYDSAYTRVSKSFFTHNKDIHEFFLNSCVMNPLLVYPMDKPLHYWKDLHPIKIIYHDSRELVSELVNFKVQFKQQPSYIVYAMDADLLLLKYAKYVQDAAQQGLEWSVEDYIQHHVMDGWFDDLRYIWLLNLSIDLAMGRDPIPYVVNEFIIPSSRVSSMLDDVRSIIKSAHDGHIAVRDLCASYWLGDYTITYMIEELTTRVLLPPLNQYAHLEMIKVLPYLEYILTVGALTHRPDVRTLASRVVIILRRWKSMNITSFITQASVKASLDSVLNRLLNLTEDILASRQ